LDDAVVSALAVLCSTLDGRFLSSSLTQFALQKYPFVWYYVGDV
jgi:hypothetical protein